MKSIPMAPDVQLVALQQAKDAHIRRPNAESKRPQAQESSHFTEQKKVRAQMRADEVMASRPDTSQALAPTTPAEERRLQEFVDEDGGGSGDPHSYRSGSPSRLNRRQTEATLQPTRTRRSAKPVDRDPSPVLTKWTQENPNWADRYKIPLIYERTTVNQVDIERLDEGEYLNDEIISFYAKYLHKELENQDGQMAKKVYVFSSFFWEKLRAKGYEGVKSWTAKVDLLSFDYIVVPINQNAHWYLAIICNPGALLPRDDHTADEDEPTVIGQEAAETAGGNEVSDQAVNVIPDVDQPDESGTSELEVNRANGARKLKAKRGPGPRKYDPKDPRVITLDSLDGNHSNVATALKHYLKAEIKQRKGIDINVPTPFGMAAKDIPFQTNFTDCGVYLLGYLEEFMKDPCEFTRHILQHEGRVWDVDAPALRNKIRDLIFDLHQLYHASQMRVRRQKRLDRKAKSQTPVDTQSPSSIASEQPVQKTPGPPAAKSENPEEAQLPSRFASEQPTRRTSAPTPPIASSLRAQSSPIRRGPKDRELSHHDSHRSISPSRPRPAGARFRAEESSQSEGSDPGALDVNASMIVHPNKSVEIADKTHAGPVDDLEVERKTPLEAEPEATLPLRESMETVDQNQTIIPESPKIQFMTAIPPSSSASRVVSSGSSGRSTRRQDTTPAHIFNQNHNETRSRYFASSSVRPSSAKAVVGTGQTRVHQLSSDDDHSRGKGRPKAKAKVRGTASSGSPGAMIDLTHE